MSNCLQWIKCKLKWTKCTKTACLDVVVIGGGISGTYTAWRLRDRGLKVALYEATDRIGGRFYTEHFEGLPTIHAELGASVFIPQEHHLLNRTIHALKLTSQSARQPSHGQNMYYLRGKHIPHRSVICLTTIIAHVDVLY